jgi:hypothetical protein
MIEQRLFQLEIVFDVDIHVFMTQYKNQEVNVNLHVKQVMWIILEQMKKMKIMKIKLIKILQLQ